MWMNPRATLDELVSPCTTVVNTSSGSSILTSNVANDSSLAFNIGGQLGSMLAKWSIASRYLITYLTSSCIPPHRVSPADGGASTCPADPNSGYAATTAFATLFKRALDLDPVMYTRMRWILRYTACSKGTEMMALAKSCGVCAQQRTSIPRTPSKSRSSSRQRWRMAAGLTAVLSQTTPRICSRSMTPNSAMLSRI
ncbi:hypothetical protein BCR44DRAFT_1448073 [Catenaria anguillulae PL171]|uniref:Uncharacterized protein n=1 Tax=Catenaria anguillulae PL171 TaxID=765915 RepID=A0A1Y2H555_9FUNG|nr:hypothetical protein BCR44DRAFT_1448073 [Catenaria anguillulae PL171]